MNETAATSSVYVTEKDDGMGKIGKTVQMPLEIERYVPWMMMPISHLFKKLSGFRRPVC